jgi:hypothetical protein
MSANAFEKLEDAYPEILKLMPNEFDSHEFILKLAQKHQKLYIEALAEYVKDDRPFQIVHGQLAMRLLKLPNLVTRVGEHISKDIFLQDSSAAQWKKV